MHIARALRATLIGSLYFLMTVKAAVAGPLEDADAADQRGDYETALRLTLPLAQQGNPNAQRRLGSIYFSGKGAPEDYVEAEKWFRRAAAQNDLDAKWNLGYMYHHGRRGIPKDFSEAEK